MADLVKDRGILSLSWPLIITFGIGVFQPMMDSWFLSRTSESAAAGVGALMPILGTIFMAIQAFSQAGASIASQFMGANANSHARTTITMVILGSILLGFSMTLLVLPSSHWIVEAMGLSGDTAKFGVEFLQVVCFGFLFRASQTTLTALIATHGLTIWNLIGNAITIVFNILLNIVFLEGLFGIPQMHVKGVALATALSWAFSSLVLWLVLRYKIRHKTKMTEVKRSRAILGDWIRIGLPAAAEPVSFQLFQVFITAMTVHLGTLAVTAKVFSANFAMFAIILGVGLGNGNQILVAHLVGAHDYKKSNRRTFQSLFASSSAGFVIALIVALCGPHLMRLYTDNPDVIALGSACLWCDVILQPFKSANVILTGSLRAAGDSKFPAIVGSLMMWTLGAGTALFLAFVLDLGLIGLWLGMASDEFYRSCANLWRWKSGRWKAATVI
ncbi:MATE family efflux transporter [Fibrobacter intestinalis]|uniref:Putative efflux protein, MATE family n=1 Tax=Fibrobacter intestinalis TaxID=28122 RepID=A0A1T4NDL4_9BACT|nr:MULTISPECIES: MATE family efflux transporter [Fibrobacter]PBC73767.1 putative MATE family efflux protein [Fibrobacter sp. NR9]SJZ77431.1 putative efflux protein, MATE family [Fibrobacter intestinalis]